MAKLGTNMVDLEIVNRSGQDRDKNVGLIVHDGQMAVEGEGGKDVGKTGDFCYRPYW